MKDRFKVSKWIILSIAILCNAFIVFYSSLDNDTTVKWNTMFSNFFASLINRATNKEIETVPLSNIEIKLSDRENYKYNFLPGYTLDEIPLGSAKQIECSFSPDDATDKSITYSASPVDSVILNQSGSTVSVVGMKAGECVITAKSNDGGFESFVKVKVVETVAPVSYEISLDNTDIAIGTTQTIKFDIDGGVLSHNELINFRYYDTRKLAYSSSNEYVAKVDEYGVIYPQTIGTSTISVTNGDYIKTIDISVIDGAAPSPYSNLSISGSDVCYANDMILDQNSKKHHYQLTPKDGDNGLNPEDFIWTSSNELLAKIDKHGVMRGFRKSSNDDENAIITAKSKLTGQETFLEIVVKNTLPTTMNYYITIGDNKQWNKDEYTISVGDNIPLVIAFDYQNSSKFLDISSSDDSVVSLTNQGNGVIIHALKEGTSIVSFKSTLNKELSSSFVCKVMPAGAISTDDILDFSTYVRKSVGHAAVFMVAQIFTYLTFYMFFYDKKWWFYSSISLGEGLFISGLSELIQFFVPSRSGAFLDVLIDFSGVLVGALLTFLGILIAKKIKARKALKENKQ